MKVVQRSTGRCAERAFNVLELMVIIVVVVIMIGLLMPTRHGNQRAYSRIHCLNDLKQVGLAFRIWAGDNHDSYPMEVYTNESGHPKFADANGCFRYFQIMSNELSTPKIINCPDDARLAATNFEADFSNAKVSYFIGLDAKESNPNMMLAGDRNLTNSSPTQNGVLTFATNRPAWWTRDLHKERGNVALTDGSVQQLITIQLKSFLTSTEQATNYLLFP